MENIRVLELYSGIGGMHYALKESGVRACVVAAVDINPTTNQIYKHNFPDTPLWNKTIEGIPLDDFNKLDFDMILMSPPCQPFTRIGRQGDIQDPRTKSFLYVLDLLPRLHRLPHWILLENVKGFETSSARECMVKTLEQCGYEFQEFLISPTCVGIPNSRLRYFMIAKIPAENSTLLTSMNLDEKIERILSDMKLDCDTEKELPKASALISAGQQEGEVKKGHVLYKLETASDAQRKTNQNKDHNIRQIQDFLEPEPEKNMEQYLLSPKTLLRYALLLDIVKPTCRRSVCFTKGYQRYVEGTGSVLQGCMSTQLESVFTDLEQCSEEEKLQRLLKLKLRYFTPREVGNLMGFPHSFKTPFVRNHRGFTRSCQRNVSRRTKTSGPSDSHRVRDN
uniref:tRNA aspartic acid methyltransferase 1 n=1 Tax=Cynoglossus semilaevis TaxID=244447 RepID=A0A3P8VK41_CYNSE